MKPILFNTEMVKAILDGRKTMTRRIIKYPSFGYFENEPPKVKCNYKVGDILYVRETYMEHRTHFIPNGLPNPHILYKANYDNLESSMMSCGIDQWKPSIHMPKIYARLFLRVTDVRVELLQDISSKQIVKEGVRTGVITHYLKQMPFDSEEYIHEAHTMAFRDIWDSTIKPKDLSLYGWEANPWVCVIEFEVISKDEVYADA